MTDSAAVVITSLSQLPVIEFNSAWANIHTAAHALDYIQMVINMRTPAMLAGGQRHYELLLEEEKLRNRLSLRWAQVTRIVGAERRVPSWRIVWEEEAPHMVGALLAAAAAD
jgi:hypothetical protein